MGRNAVLMNLLVFTLNLTLLFILSCQETSLPERTHPDQIFLQAREDAQIEGTIDPENEERQNCILCDPLPIAECHNFCQSVCSKAQDIPCTLTNEHLNKDMRNFVRIFRNVAFCMNECIDECEKKRIPEELDRCFEEKDCEAVMKCGDKYCIRRMY